MLQTCTDLYYWKGRRQGGLPEALQDATAGGFEMTPAKGVRVLLTLFGFPVCFCSDVHALLSLHETSANIRKSK